MTNAPKILSTDTLRQSYPKLNQSIENSNNAISFSKQAYTNSNDARTLVENVKTQLEQLVIEGDSSVEAAAARVDEFGTSYTTLQDRLNAFDSYMRQNEINVKQPPFNLKGDGTDETSAIQAIFDLAQTSENVRIYFPEGTYGISQYIRIYKNTTVRLHGQATLLRIGLTQRLFVNGPVGDQSYASAYDGDGNIHFYGGGTVDLNAEGAPLATTAGISAFDLGHGENITFQDVTITNGQNGHYFQVAGCRNVVFDKCRFLNQRHTNTSSTNFECLQIESINQKDANGNTSFPTFGSFDDTPSMNVRVSGCVFDRVIRAVGTHGINQNGQHSKDISIENCVFTNSSDHPIYLAGYDGVSLTNNVVRDCEGAAIRVNQVRAITESGTRIYNQATFGVYLEGMTDSVFNDLFIQDSGKSRDSGITAEYPAIRLVSSHNNTFYNPTVRTAKANHSYGYYESGSINNRLIKPRIDPGYATYLSGRVYSEDFNTIVYERESEVLFDGNLSSDGQSTTLSYHLRSYKAIVVFANTTDSDTAWMTQLYIPKEALTIGSNTQRYRIYHDSGYLGFSFPNTTGIRRDAGTGYIRKVIGIS
ncbi:right-handed parallel beta-helix repeat-containing protein [Cytobacillus sp. FSL R7-0696]|uniref:right-handed parallel beta-helix repeat-containing protein n=1 Tax=Cytobacillus sp. FSL R7-0696 TaxID=2921691 RepID=UPI0030F95F02